MRTSKYFITRSAELNFLPENLLRKAGQKLENRLLNLRLDTKPALWRGRSTGCSRDCKTAAG